jgi:hypothetical protein
MRLYFRDYRQTQPEPKPGFVKTLAGIFHLFENKDEKRVGHDPSAFTKSLGFSPARQHDSGELVDQIRSLVVDDFTFSIATATGMLVSHLSRCQADVLANVSLSAQPVCRSLPFHRYRRREVAE